MTGKTKAEPLTNDEKRYLELLDLPGPYRNPRWHDDASMMEAMGKTQQEIRVIVASLTKKGHLKGVLDGLFSVRPKGKRQ